MFAKSVFLFICILSALMLAQAAPGDLDMTFGIGGKVTYRFNDREDTFRGVVVQPDGKIVAAGKNGDGRMMVIRYNPNGTFDTTFGTGGIYTSTAPFFIPSTAIALLPDGKIVVSGIFPHSGNDTSYLVLKLNQNGTPDIGFGDQGIVFMNISSGIDMTRDIVVQSDGKILVCGSVNDTGVNGSDVGLMRFLPNGALDPTFNEDGIVTTTISLAEQGYAMKLQPDGKIVVLANADNGNTFTYYQALVRYLPDGTLDSSFGNGGISLTNLNGSYFSFGDLEIQPDGKFVTLNSIGNNGTFIYAFTVARYLPDGSPDTTFGTNGKTVIVSGNSNIAQALEIQKDGKIIAVGHSMVPGNGLDIIVSRLNTDGSFDPTFGNGGKVFTEVGPAPRSDYGFDVALQPDGKIVVAGDFNAGTLFDYDAVVLRYMGDAVNPSSKPFDFDGDGKTDISIFRPSPGEWWYQKSSDNQVTAAQFGNGSDKLAPRDFTGDGKTDLAFWRSSTGEWFILRSENGSYFSFPFGSNGDVPVVGDFDADGKADAAVFRPSNSTWYISRTSGGTSIVRFGQTGDVPVAADYDGDRKADIAVFRPSDRSWWILKSSNNSTSTTVFGAATDKPTASDFSGDGKADIAVFRPTTGEWFVLRSEDSSYFSFPFGANGDTPVPGDYDGDGKTDAAVFRPSSSTLYINRTTAGILITNFGTTGDIAVPSAFIQ